MFWGTFLSVPAIWFFALAGNFPMLVASFMLLQLFVNIAHGPYQALIPDMIPPERHGVASGYMGLWQLVGQLGSFILSALLLSGYFGKYGMFYLFAAFTALFVGLMAMTVRNVQETPYDGPVMNKRGAIRAIFKTDLKGNPSFVWVLISRFLINLGFYTALLYLKWYLTFALKVQASKVDIYTLILAVVVTLTGLVGTMPAGRLADRISKKTIIYGTCALCTVAAILFWSAGSIGWAIVAAAVFGLGFGAFAAVDWALACNVLPEGDAAKFLGIWTFSFVVPQMAAAFVGDMTISIFITHGQAFAYRMVFAAIIPFMILGTLSVSRVREKAVGKA
jgi:Na+/melibiose symporter-like transporter